MAIGSIVIVIYILLVQTTTAGSRDIQQGRKKPKKKLKLVRIFTRQQMYYQIFK